MATYQENLISRRDTIATELAAMTSKPSYSVDGQSVDHPGHRRALLDELKQLNELIILADGPFEVRTQGAT